ncbi:MAG TPA: peptidylprolyl isomerase [Chthoniobacterales bacterium]|nr:peptidylprolyl isomerase [Chthoniobacterales bacterium]
MASILGLSASELLYRSAAFRDLAGRLSGRGRLVVIANEKGIYETDRGGEEETSAGDLVALENLRRASAKEAVDPAQVDREIALFEAQFGSGKFFRNALRRDGLSISALRERVTNQLRSVAWLERQVRTSRQVSVEECRQFYDMRRDFFTRPVRFRVTHLFLAAHAETPPEVVEEKELAIAALDARLRQGEPLSQLAAEASEDQASKRRGGDLGYFSEARMTPEFIAEIKTLRGGDSSKPFRSHLGFHIAQLTEMKEASLLSFPEARPEISRAIGNDARIGEVNRIFEDLSRPGK